MQHPLKLSPVTLRGKRFATHDAAFKSGKCDLKRGLFDKNKYCTCCKKTTHVLDHVTCCMCGRIYHTNCLADKLSRTTVMSLAKNPSLWWFCLECLHISNSLNSRCLVQTDGHTDKQTNGFYQRDLYSDRALQQHLADMKSDIMAQVSTEIDHKLAQLSLSRENIASSSSDNSQESQMLPNFTSKCHVTTPNFEAPVYTSTPTKPGRARANSEKSRANSEKLRVPQVSSSSGVSEASSSSLLSDKRPAIFSPEQKYVSPKPRPFRTPQYTDPDRVCRAATPMPQFRVSPNLKRRKENSCNLSQIKDIIEMSKRFDITNIEEEACRDGRDGCAKKGVTI